MRSFPPCPRGLDSIIRKLHNRGYHDIEVDILPSGAAYLKAVNPERYVIIVQSDGYCTIFDWRVDPWAETAPAPQDVLDLPDMSVPLFPWDPPDQESSTV